MTTTRACGARTDPISCSARTSRCNEIAPTDDNKVVGGLKDSQGGLIAPRSLGVVTQFLVVFEGEADVDNHDLGEPSGDVEHPLQRGAPDFGPPGGNWYAGQDAQSR